MNYVQEKKKAKNKKTTKNITLPNKFQNQISKSLQKKSTPLRHSCMTALSPVISSEIWKFGITRELLLTIECNQNNLDVWHLWICLFAFTCQDIKTGLNDQGHPNHRWVINLNNGGFGCGLCSKIYVSGKSIKVQKLQRHQH